MKTKIALSLALSLMTSAAFAAPAILTPATQPQQIAQDGSDRTIDRLHKQMGDEARVADNGSERTIDRLHKQMKDIRVAENGSEHTIDRLHGKVVAESGGDTVFDAHLKRVS